MRHGRRDFLRKAAPTLAALAVLATPALALALEVEVSAVLGRSTITLGESVYLQVEVTLDGSSRAIQPPRFAKLAQVDISSRGTSTGMSVDMGPGGTVQRATKTFTYVLSPRAAGEHVIAIEVDVAGQTYKPAVAPKLTVNPPGFEPEPEEAEAGDRPPAPDSDVIVWPVVDKTKAYVGEQIVYELQIWDRSSGNLTVATQPTFKDFWSENLDDPRKRRHEYTRDEIDGVPYRVHSALRRALFPQKAGTLTIGGPKIEAQAFAGPFFGGTGPPRTFVGRSLAVEVLPLPADGQPPNFRANNVGQFRVSTEVDRAKLRQGEAVSLSVRIAGTGNIALVELPPLAEIPGVRSYEPKPETPQIAAGKEQLQGSRVYEVLLVAEQAGTIEIPAVELPYFDPKSGKYHVAKSKPITLEVEADPNAENPADSPTQAKASNGDEELLAPPIANQTLPRVTVREPWLTNERWWLGSLAAPAVLALGWLGLSLRERYGPDDEARARSREAARRRALLNQANAAIDSGDGFYPTLGSLLHTAAVVRAGAEGVGLTRDRLMKLLLERGVPKEEVDQLTELLEACDAARFGAGGGDVAQRRAHLEQARALLGRRAWRLA